MILRLLTAVVLFAAAGAPHAAPAQLFPLSDVRLTAGPFLDAQNTGQAYLLTLDPDRLLAPFRREAGLPLPKPSYGNWESSGLDGHMGGHYLSALALMYASTGDAEMLARLNKFIAGLREVQQKNGDGYIGGIPGGATLWQAIARGEMQADNFSVNGKWVPWYNLHKMFAGLRDAHQHAGSKDARAMLIALSDWTLALTARLTQEQMQAMLRSEHGGMNEVLADVARLTGDDKYMALARRFSHQAILDPLARGEDQLNGLHANTQIPKVIGFKRIADLTGERRMQDAARFFWQTVHDKRTVAIGGNSVKEHFHDTKDFSSMIGEVEGPETCNTYNMLKLSGMLFLTDPRVAYTDYIERGLYNHILASQRPKRGGFAYFTPMRPNHYRVYSQPEHAMWCCVGSGIESHARHGEFIYAHDGNSLYVNLFIASTLTWRDRNVRLTQATRFPDQASSRITVHDDAAFALKIRYPRWVAAGALKLRVNGKPYRYKGGPGDYITLDRQWRPGDRIDVSLPMTTRLEQMPDGSNYYAVLHGPIVLAAKTAPFANEKLSFLADDSRMGHIASGPVCELSAAPMLVSDTKDFMHRFRPVRGEPLTFSAPGLIRGKDAGSLRLIPFFRLHESRYTIYWPYSTPADAELLQAATAMAEAERLELDARTVDQVAPGQQQPESDHGFKGEGAEAGVNGARHWRHATGWFSYELNDPKGEASILRLTFARGDAGRRFDIVVDGVKIAGVTLGAPEGEDFYTVDYPVAPARPGSKMTVRFVAQPGSIAGGLYGLRLLR
ncbi:glycoside hydrolase family 127 protein [Massilia sp. PAMC28688]|uniref:glycoside hydrolase family 127 protein n=1 Tax=Massilia sp. PAMC28688 TaxID=2861283 RepID=UPI001C6353F4|nr:glycoside hydrolase family 127 protein [Massilia sp. PAMC28688]QYF92672.1 glycoside hydrolase family 127 protein [Massilia sp. PAMC28688]